jgi:hypothetical protein
MIDAEIERPPGVNIVEFAGVMNRKIGAVMVLAQFIALGDENGKFSAPRQIRQKLGVVISDPRFAGGKRGEIGKTHMICGGAEIQKDGWTERQ